MDIEERDGTIAPWIKLRCKKLLWGREARAAKCTDSLDLKAVCIGNTGTGSKSFKINLPVCDFEWLAVVITLPLSHQPRRVLVDVAPSPAPV